jgi:XTP/dITP diphosphohydrolase
MSKPSLVFATHNKHKLEEVQAILSDTEFNIIGLDDIGFHTEIEETGALLEDNALIKSRAVSAYTELPVFSDDTGLEVFALDMAPGVYTARFAGSSKDAHANMDKLLDLLKDKNDRRARFRTAVALILEGREYLFEGIVEGRIALEKSGVGGFGYDPVFIPEDYDRTFAELSAEQKNTISHRFRAIDHLRNFLKAQ